MTNVTILRSKEGIRGFVADGHSGYADAGSDIVCSAISALTQSAAMGLSELLHISLDLQVKDGSMRCLLPSEMRAQTREEANLILETMVLGIRAIQETYGDYIKLTERKV